MYFEFDEDVTIISLDFVDKDNGTDGKIKVYDDGNDQIGSTIYFYDGGNASVQTVSVNRAGVRKLKIDYDDSGGVTNIRFTRDNGPPCGIECYVPAEGELCFVNPDDPEIIGAESIWTSVWSTDDNTGIMTLRIVRLQTKVDWRLHSLITNVHRSLCLF
ncbi:MAG: hypothetical protein QF371_02050 [Flavobacteriales bacterium]|jgi:hypothetical protein|nr:hypothetical protein [Flavobacteriales bacterium]